MFSKMLAKCADIFPKIYQHSFNQKLYDGTLSATTFRFYLQQDKLYLCDFSQALLQISKQFEDVNNEENARQFAELASYVKDGELALHRDYLQDSHSFHFFHHKEPETIKINSIEEYTGHLLYTTKTASVEEAMASVLPCFWIYSKLGKQMDISSCSENHPYRKWIATYSDEEYIKKMEAVIGTLEKFGQSVNCSEHQEKIIEAFVKSATFELMFFDEAMADQREILSIGEEYQLETCMQDNRM